jgi:hypothetical protein
MDWGAVGGGKDSGIVCYTMLILVKGREADVCIEEVNVMHL